LIAIATAGRPKFTATDWLSASVTSRTLQGRPSSMAGMAESGSGAIHPAALNGIAASASAQTIP
jgi:hypothetical protein